MEAILITAGLYLCFLLIVVGAYLAFPAEPSTPARHWAEVHPGDIVLVRGEPRRVVDVDPEHDRVRLDRPYDPPPLPGDWVVVRHDERGWGTPAPAH